MAAIKALKQESAIVLVETKNNDWSLVPSLVQESMNSPQAGKYIPKTVVADAELSKVISVVPYNGNEKDRTKLFREAEKLIRAEATASAKTQPASHEKETATQEKSSGELPRVVVCKADVDAFNLADPKQSLGKFLAGSSLTLESKHPDSGMWVVVFKQPDGSEVRALCRPEDL